ncbi:MAG: transcription factor S4 [Thermoprotei archaeon]
MRFCPKCGSALFPKGEWLICRRCGYRERAKEEVKFTETIDHSRDRTIVADGRKVGQSMAAVLCPKCGYLLAEIINPRRKLYKCKACGYVFTVR